MRDERPGVRDAGPVTRPLALLGALALLLVASGAVVLAVATPVGLGWFTYGAPPPEQLSTSAAVVWSGTQVAGAALVVLGLLTAAAAAGYRAGRRARRQAAERPMPV